MKSEVGLPDRENSVDEDSEEVKRTHLEEQTLRVAVAQYLSGGSGDWKGSESLKALVRPGEVLVKSFQVKPGEAW